MGEAREGLPGRFRHAGLALAVCLLLALSIGTGPAIAAEPSGVSVVAGQEPYEVAQLFEQPFFQRLFGNEEPPPRRGPKVFRLPAPEQEAPAVRRTRPAPERRQPAERTAPKRITVPKPAVIETPKDPDAKRVLVVGDTFADSLAGGLEVAFADTPGVRIVDATEPEAGLADPAALDVAETVRQRVQGDEPADAVVVMLGYHDRTPMLVDGREVAFRSEEWERVYRARVRDVISAAREEQVPVYWVGLMPSADIDITTDIAYLDEIYRQEAGPLFAVYVDVWNPFTDEVGGVLRSGPDVAGQVRQLRLKDGVGFTKSGSRKLAFYVEQEIRAWIERGAPATALPQVPGVGLVLSLNDPEVGPEEDLAGGGATTAPKSGTALYDLVVQGRPLPPRVGRVDDLSTVR